MIAKENIKHDLTTLTNDIPITTELQWIQDHQQHQHGLISQAMYIRQLEDLGRTREKDKATDTFESPYW